jgi:hypothetical protein
MSLLTLCSRAKKRGKMVLMLKIAVEGGYYQRMNIFFLWQRKLAILFNVTEVA